MSSDSRPFKPFFEIGHIVCAQDNFLFAAFERDPAGFVEKVVGIEVARSGDGSCGAIFLPRAVQGCGGEKPDLMIVGTESCGGFEGLDGVFALVEFEQKASEPYGIERVGGFGFEGACGGEFGVFGNASGDDGFGEAEPVEGVAGVELAGFFEAEDAGSVLAVSAIDVGESDVGFGALLFAF